MGSHILDVARFLFGEARTVTCQMARIHPDIRGEDVATVMLHMVQGTTVVCSLSYASQVEHDRFNETYVHIECERGSVSLGPDYWVRVTTEASTMARRCVLPRYPWVDPAYEVVQTSIVPCNAHLLHALRSGQPAATSGEDNLRTMRLVAAAYESAERGCVVKIAE
jgi:predicted dehydrogenase